MPVPDNEPSREVSVRVWDIPTRLFHWLIVALFAFSWWTAENDQLEWHMRSGYAILGLVIFRLYWGFAGSRSARFASFLQGPKIFLAYSARLLERSGRPALGHNPMGGWSVVAFIALLLTQTVLGLFTVDVEGLTSGPLSYLVSFDTGRRFAGLHHRIFNFLLILIALHIAAMLFYWLYKRENLIIAMITGRKRMKEQPGIEPEFTSLWWVIPGALAAGLIVAYIALGHF